MYTVKSANASRKAATIGAAVSTAADLARTAHEIEIGRDDTGQVVALAVIDGKRISVEQAQDVLRLLGADPRENGPDGFHWPYAPTLVEVASALKRWRYAPPAPDSRFHRPGDTAYIRELLAVAGLSQRAAGPLLGFDERSMRYKVAGEKPLSYTEQYCLEVLADAKAGSSMNAAHEATPIRDAQSDSRTAWHTPGDRPLTRDDAGQIIVAKDRFGAPIHGTLIHDGFGLVVQDASGLDVRQIPVDRVALYALLDPPPAGADTDAAARNEDDPEPPSSKPGGFQTHVRTYPPRK